MSVTCLITGATGFVGGHLAEACVRRGIAVRALARAAADTNVDGYTQTKVESEKLALRYHREHGVPVVVLRPGFIYGPRDRTVLPNLIDRLRQQQVPYLGGGKRALNTIYVGNLVDAIFL